MTDKMRKRKFALLPAILLAMVLIVSGCILGVDQLSAVRAANAANGSASGATDEIQEDTYTSASPTTQTWTTAGSYTYTALPGRYKLEVWGGQGGTYTANSYGGYGGYTYAEFTTTTQITLYVVVGGAGGYGSTAKTAAHNGGGIIVNGHPGGGGGGASHIATSSGLLASLASNKDAILIVAGGGGGYGCRCAVGTCYSGQGGGGNNSGTPAPPQKHSTNRGGGYEGTLTGPGNGGIGNTAANYGLAGSFGKGGNQPSTQANTGGGAGGAGYYGGGAGGCDGANDNDDGAGGGGSGFVNTSRVIASTYGGTTGQNGNTTATPSVGKATVTPLNTAPIQNGTPTIALNRTSSVTIPLEGTSSTGSLLMDDIDSNERVQLRTTGIFMSGAASGVNASVAGSSNGYWIDYTANAGATSITLKAKRWWSDTKRFYINVTDFNTTYNASPGADVWFSFLATCATGSPAIQGGPTNLGVGGTNDTSKFHYGNSGFTTVATAARPKSANVANSLYNPTGSGNATVWIADAITANTTLHIKAEDLFLSSRNAEEKIAFTGALTYGANRYSSTSTTAAVAESITGGANNSSYVSTASFSDRVALSYYNGTSVTPDYTRGYDTLDLTAKGGVPAGAYYYVITVPMHNLCRSAGGVVGSTWNVDIVYRVDNTRPNFVSPGPNEPSITVQSGATESISLASICTDPDGNTLTIADVVVPQNEFVLINQYGVGRKLPTGTNYNYGVNDSILVDETRKNFTSSITTAQLPSSPTGFSADFIYGVTGASAADQSFVSSQASSQGNADVSYAGYYVNSARNTLYIVGNKASRNLYAQGGKTRKADFYILVRITDTGNLNDTGIWFPIAIEVTSSAPVSLNSSSATVVTGTPSVTGDAGESYYFSPLTYKDTASGNIFAIGAYADDETYSNLSQDTLLPNGNGGSVKPLVFDVDNYSYAAGNSSGRKIGNQTIEGSNVGTPTTYAQRETVFLSAISGVTDWNAQIFAGLAESNDPITSVMNGFKEFFTIERVPLYARTGVLLGLTDNEVQSLVSNNVIWAERGYVAFYGIKITLRKHTMGKYLSFSVDVTDSHNSTSRIRIAVSVNNTPLTNASARGGVPTAQVDNYNLRNGITERMYDEESNDDGVFQYPIFRFSVPMNTDIRISPYDLFYNPDTYRANLYGLDGSFLAYNTMPEETSAHAALLRGLDKKICVLAADTAAATPTEITDFHLKRIRISNIDPNVAGTYYGAVSYVRQSDTMAEHFLIHTLRKTPASGYISFNYMVTTTAGNSAMAEIRIYVENSLPVVRTSPTTVPSVFWLSAAPSYGNSSATEEKQEDGYFKIDSETYNVREFTLDDLFVDLDGDGVQFYDANPVVRVGTMDSSGIWNAEHFLDFTAEQNIFIAASVGPGSNGRETVGDCVIIEGLSSTQGVPGGVWICLRVTDNALGTVGYREYCFQVEVVNTRPEYAEMTGTNAMELTYNEYTDAEDTYVWKTEAETSSPLYSGIRDSQNVEVNEVIKPLYVASGSQSMEAYKALVRGGYSDTDAQGNPITVQRATFNYSDAQVRYIAQDKDAGQGLVLDSSAYDGTAVSSQGFDVLSDNRIGTVWTGTGAVAINNAYGSTVSPQYYAANHVVKIFYFKTVEENGTSRLVRTVDPAETNVATDWVVAFTFPTNPGSVDIRLRLRDSDAAVEMPTGAQAATQGGHTVTTTHGSYFGDRTERGIFNTSTGAYEPNASVSSSVVFGFKVQLQSQGLYNNLTKWSTDETVDGVSVKDVWTATGDEDEVLYYHQQFPQDFPDGVTDASLFRYNGITIGSERYATGVQEGQYIGTSIPLSYFAFSANNVMQPLRGTSQTDIAWFNVSESNVRATRDTAANTVQFASRTAGIQLDSYIFSAITLYDGYNTWRGDTLNANPYIDFRVISGISEFAGSNYLYGQQRFRVSLDDGVEKIPVVSESSAYFYEDINGLRLTKKAVRSIGTTLSMTIRMVPWVYDADSATYIIDRGQNGDEDKSIDVTVPLFVENSILQLDNDTVDIEMTSDVVGRAVNLATKPTTDAEGSTTVTISTIDTVDQVEGTIGILNIAYREDMYFLANSIVGNFSEENLAYMREALAGNNPLVDEDMQARIVSYFGVSDASDVFDGTALGANVRINPFYSNYFSVSPSGVDGKSFTIVPRRLTTFDTSGFTTKTALDSAASARGLKIGYTASAGETIDPAEDIEAIYYPLKLIVYDRISIGVSSNCTKFTDSSFDVITVNIRILNSAPTVQTGTFNQEISDGRGGIICDENDNPIMGRTIELTKGGRATVYKFTDIVQDVDMVLNRRTRNYLTHDDIEALQDTAPDNTETYNAEAAIIKDTADYFKTLENGNLVRVEFLPLGNTNGITNRYDPDTKTGAVSCQIGDDSIEISVENRAPVTENGIAAKIKVTFSDSHGEHISAIIAIQIVNSAPQLTDNASRTNSITMYTGQYFTLYAAPWASFAEGLGISDTVGRGTEYDGTYFQAMESNGSDIGANLPVAYQSWSYNASLGNVIIDGENPNYEDLDYANKRKFKQNLGYMAIADDDAAWTLRISDVTVGASREIDVTPLNHVLYEGTQIGNSEAIGATAVMFEAKSACTDVSVSITVSDGHKSVDDRPLSVTYTFKITVISTKPVAITAITEAEGSRTLGASLLDTEWEGRLSHTEQIGGNNIYKLQMYAGESITFKTSDFATDIDEGDEEILYLLGLNGGSPFTIANEASALQCISIDHRSGNLALTTNSTQFTVTALNFQSDTANASDLYADVQFYISDPHHSDIQNSVLIQLRIYVYPHQVAASTGAKTVTVKSLAAYEESNVPQSVSLVSVPRDGGLFEDKDASAVRTKYSVKLYTMLYYSDPVNNVVGMYSREEFAALSDTEKERQLVAAYDAATGVTTSFATGSSHIVQQYIDALTFADNGRTLRVVPRKATNNAKYIVDDGEKNGISLQVEIEKFTNREGAASGDYGPLYPSEGDGPALTATSLLHLVVDNSAPVEVGDTNSNFNIRGDSHPYLSVDGMRGDSWEFYIYNPLSTRDEALFIDPDGDTVSYADSRISAMYTLDSTGTEVTSHIDTPGLRATAENAIIITPHTLDYTAADGSTVTLPSLGLSVRNKIDIAGYEGLTVYIEVTVFARDEISSTLASTTITVGIYNSQPSFKDKDEIDEKYDTAVNQTAYDRIGADATMTLTLSRDADDRLLSQNNNGSLRIELSDLVKDMDFTTDETNIESFALVAPEVSMPLPDLHAISGDTSATLWLDNGDYGVARSDAELEDAGDVRFTVRVDNAKNTALVFTVHSYERGATEQLVLIVEDSSGARTGVLTITLQVGNSAPVDKTLTGEVDRNIILAGGKAGTGGNNTFEPITYSILDYVRDNNPHDSDSISDTPTEARTYLRIVDFTIRSISFDSASDFSEYIKEDSPEAEPPSLVNIARYEQTFTVAPLAQLYGKQTVEFEISDAGNSNDIGSKTIYVSLEIQITKNPGDMPTYDYSVYWKRTMDVTAKDIFDDPKTPDEDESSGLLIVGITVHNSLQDVAVPVGDGTTWAISGLIRNESVLATANVIVGTSYTEGALIYPKSFTIHVLDNGKPVFNLNDDGVSWGTGITNISQDILDKKGKWTVPITTFLRDEEGDDLHVVSVSSTKSTLINVGTDGENLTFHFKSSGDTTVKVRVSDAVTTYSYSFRIGNTDLPEPNFFIGIISRIQGNPIMYIIIGCAIILLLIILFAILGAIGRKRRMQEEIEAMLVSEMELEDRMMRLAAGSSSKAYYQQGATYTPPPQIPQAPGVGMQPNIGAQPGFMIGSGQMPVNPNDAIGLNPGSAQSGAEPPDNGFGEGNP